MEEDLLVRERAAEQNVHYLLKNKSEPVVNLLQAFDEYRQLCETCVFADFEHGAARREAVLWQAHTEGKKYFSSTLKEFRKKGDEQPVATRHLMKLYLQFIKESQRFYREHINRLSTTFGGIPELEVVAHRVKQDERGESSQSSVSLELRKTILDSCHHTLICLGDLSRYRASEKLDKTPDFGPAIGYYSLACTLRPSSGMGYHQQAVIALEQRNHLHATYHLYRAMVVGDPHPYAANNLKKEFEKTNAAWDRGELILKGPPNDPEASKRTLVGWFVRLHSMCYKGEPFRGYDELEREVLSQLAAEIKQRSIDSTLMRMVMTNMAASYNAGERFQGNMPARNRVLIAKLTLNAEDPTQQHQDAFLHFFRFNVKTYTTLLDVFFTDLNTVDLHATNSDGEVQLASRITEIMRRVLPALRLYSSWLLMNTHLLAGLSTDDLAKDAIGKFWITYAVAIDKIAHAFSIWDLEDVAETAYLLEEDAETVGFKPLSGEKTEKIWHNKQTGAVKPRFSDFGVGRVSIDDEMLARVKELLSDGLNLANDDDNAPIKLYGSSVLHRDAQEPQFMPMPAGAIAAPRAATPKAVQTATQTPAGPKPLSYAAAAAVVRSSANPTIPKGASSASTNGSRQDQLVRMVDDLVKDDEGRSPITPPQQHATTPVVVTKPDVSYSALPGSDPDFAQLPRHSHQPVQKPIGSGPGMQASPRVRTPKSGSNGRQTSRLQSISGLWRDTPNSSTSTHFPAGLATGTLSSPAHIVSRGYSRVNSASSIRSRTSQDVMHNTRGVADSWSSLESAPRATGGFATPYGAVEQTNVASPLLFGAGGGLWSTPKSAFRNVTPPNGQG